MRAGSRLLGQHICLRAGSGREESCTSYLLKERGGLGDYVLVRLVVRDGEEAAAHCKAPATWAAAAPATAAVLGSDMSLVAS